MDGSHFPVFRTQCWFQIFSIQTEIQISPLPSHVLLTSCCTQSTWVVTHGRVGEVTITLPPLFPLIHHPSPTVWLLSAVHLLWNIIHIVLPLYLFDFDNYDVFTPIDFSICLPFHCELWLEVFWLYFFLNHLDFQPGCCYFLWWSFVSWIVCLFALSGRGVLIALVDWNC